MDSRSTAALAVSVSASARFFSAHQRLGAEQGQHQQRDEATEPGRRLAVVAGHFLFGRVVDRFFNRVGQLFADLRRQVDVDFFAGQRGQGGHGRAGGLATLAAGFRRRGRFCGRFGSFGCFGRFGRGRRRRFGGLGVWGAAVVGRAFGFFGIFIALAAHVEANAAVVDHDIGVGAFAFFVTADYFLLHRVRRKQFVLKDGSGDQHQHREHQELPPRQLSHPGGGRVEAAMQPGGGGLQGVLRFWHRKHVRLSLLRAGVTSFVTMQL